MPKLRRVVDTLDGLDEPIKGLYEKSDDGKYRLPVDVSDLTAKVDEFRDRNTELTSRVEDLTTEIGQIRDRFKGVDPDRYKRAVDALSKVEEDEDRKLIEEGKIEEVISKRIGTMREEYESRVGGLDAAVKERDAQIGQLSGQLGELVLGQALGEAVEKLGLRFQSGASESARDHANKRFRVNEKAKLEARKGVFGADGKPLTWDEYVKRLPTEASYLFVQGGGGEGGPDAPRQNRSGKMVISRHDATAIGKYAKELRAGTAVLGSPEEATV